MAIVQFLEYRRHDQARTDANNAIMALLAGAHLASHTLQLTEGSSLLLPAIFPQVSHIQRFNLHTGKARELLRDAEVHLGGMAVPYMLALHEDFVVTCLELSGRSTRYVKASNMHRRLADALPAVQWGPHLGAFHAARILRNCLIHSGGLVTNRTLAELQADVDAAGEAEWVRHSGRSPRRLQIGQQITIGHGELVATLSATHNLAKAINHALADTLPRATWADKVIDDIRETNPQLLTANTQLRKCVGFARHHYGPLGLGEDEIASALRRAGYEKRPTL